MDSGGATAVRQVVQDAGAVGMQVGGQVAADGAGGWACSADCVHGGDVRSEFDAVDGAAGEVEELVHGSSCDLDHRLCGRATENG